MPILSLLTVPLRPPQLIFLMMHMHIQRQLKTSLMNVFINLRELQLQDMLVKGQF